MIFNSSEKVVFHRFGETKAFVCEDSDMGCSVSYAWGSALKHANTPLKRPFEALTPDRRKFSSNSHILMDGWNPKSLFLEQIKSKPSVSWDKNLPVVWNHGLRLEEKKLQNYKKRALAKTSMQLEPKLVASTRREVRELFVSQMTCALKDSKRFIFTTCEREMHILSCGFQLPPAAEFPIAFPNKLPGQKSSCCVHCNIFLEIQLYWKPIDLKLTLPNQVLHCQREGLSKSEYTKEIMCRLNNGKYLIWLIQINPCRVSSLHYLSHIDRLQVHNEIACDVLIIVSATGKKHIVVVRSCPVFETSWDKCTHHYWCLLCVILLFWDSSGLTNTCTSRSSMHLGSLRAQMSLSTKHYATRGKFTVSIWSQNSCFEQEISIFGWEQQGFSP